MSDNNLTIDVAVRTAQARADIKLLNAEINKTSAALRDAVKAGDTGGQTAQYQALTGQYQQLARAQATVTAAKKADTAATKENTQANRAHSASLKESGLELGHLAHAAGLPVEGLRALRAGFVAFAAVEVVRGVTAIADRLNGITNAAKASGVTVEFLKGLQNAFIEAGESADKAEPMMANFNKVLRESRLTPVFDPKGPFESLGIGSSLAYEQTLQGTQRAAAAAAREILRLKQIGRIDDANTASLKNFGFELAVIEQQLRKIATGTLRKFPAPTPAEVAALAAYNEAVAALSVAWDNLMGALGQSGAVKLVSDFVNELTKGINDSIQQVKDLIAWFQRLDAAIAKAAPFGGTRPDTGGGDYGGGGDQPTITGASGGYVRGAGSGTSDSILARLSNGEFVINASAVQRLGTGFLHSLNSFAAGGLVGMPPIRFAAGGLASASAGGRPVHLHLGSRSFALSGSSGVVDALVSEANWQQMRSAGTKPSWFGGRPGTR